MWCTPRPPHSAVHCGDFLPSERHSLSLGDRRLPLPRRVPGHHGKDQQRRKSLHSRSLPGYLATTYEHICHSRLTMTTRRQICDKEFTLFVYCVNKRHGYSYLCLCGAQTLLVVLSFNWHLRWIGIFAVQRNHLSYHSFAPPPHAVHRLSVVSYFAVSGGTVAPQFVHRAFD